MASPTASVSVGNSRAMGDCYRGCRGWPAEKMPPEWEGVRKTHTIQASSVFLIENSAPGILTLAIKVVVGLETRAIRTPYSTNSSLYHGPSRHQHPQSCLTPSSTWVLGAPWPINNPRSSFLPFGAWTFPPLYHCSCGVLRGSLLPSSPLCFPHNHTIYRTTAPRPCSKSCCGILLMKQPSLTPSFLTNSPPFTP